MSLFRTTVVLLFCISASGVQSVQAEILMGLAATLTGQFARSGEQYRTIAEVALVKINRPGGYVGEQVRFYPRLTDDFGRTLFRVCGCNDRQGQVVGEYLFDQWKEAERAIAHNGTTNGEGLAQITERHIDVRGATTVDSPSILLSSLVK